MELKINHICKFCNEEFSTGALLGTHISKQCLKNPNRGIQKNSKIWKCSICGNDFLSRRRLQQHRKEEHINEIKGKFYGYHPEVNKPCQFCGLICKRTCDLTKHEKFCKENPNKQIWRGHKTSDETKKKLSEAAIKNLSGTHCNWLNKRKSYAEEYFETIFTDAESQYQVGRYTLDFAWTKSKTYIEVDGEQHYTKEGIEHDKIRTEFLIEKGWRLLKRIRWSEFQKLSKIERENEIYRLLQTIKMQESSKNK